MAASSKLTWIIVIHYQSISVTVVDMQWRETFVDFQDRKTNNNGT